MNVSATTNTGTDEPKTDLTTDEVLAKIDELVNLANYLKRVAKPIVRKMGKKRTKTAGGDATTQKRNGFAVPVVMAPQLITFLNNNCNKNFDTNSELPRTEVTSMITAYIKEKNLQTPDNRKNFVVDAALATVFGVDEGTESNWFSMQKLLTSVIVSAKKRTNEEAAAPAPAEAPTPSARSTASEPASSNKSAGGGKRIKRG